MARMKARVNIKEELINKSNMYTIFNNARPMYVSHTDDFIKTSQ